MYGGGSAKKLKYVGGGSAQKNMQGGVPGEKYAGGAGKICRGVDEKNIKCTGESAKKKCVRGVGEKIKICEGGGSEKFSIPPHISISNGIALYSITDAQVAYNI